MSETDRSNSDTPFGKDNTKRLPAMLENFPDAFGIFTAVRDKNGQILDFRVDFLNTAACQLHALHREASIGKHLCELLPRTRTTGLFDDICHALTRKAAHWKTYYFEDYQETNYLGHWDRVLSISISPDEDSVAISWRDMTQHISDRSSSNHHGPRLNDLVRDSADGILVVGDDGRVVFANPAAEQFLGKSPGGAVGYHLGYPVAGPEPSILHFRSPSGESSIVEMRTSRTAWNGRPSLVVNLRDITQRVQAEQEHLQTLHLLKEAERVSHLGVWEWDFKSEEFRVSNEWQQIHQCHRGILTEVEFLSFVHPDDRGDFEDALEAARRGVQSIDIEHRIVPSDSGETRYLQTRGEILRDERGISGLLGTATDLTEQHRSTEEIRFQARMLASIGEAVIVTDPTGEIRFWNRPAERLYGWRAEEVLGHIVTEVTPSVETRNVAEEIMKSLSRGEQWSGEFEVKRKDGTSFPARVTDTPVFDEEGRLDAMIGISSDVTEVHRAHDESRRSLRRTYDILESLSDGFFALDENLTITYFNAAAEMLLNRSRQDVVGKALLDAFPQVKGSTFEERYHEALRSKQSSTFESYFDKPPYANWYEVRVHPAARGISVFFNVTTERKKMEEERREMEIQLQQAQKMESIGRLAGGVAHDFNNVLQGVTGYSEILHKRLPEEAKEREFVEQILSGARKAADLTQQLLGFARKQTISPRVLDLNESIEGMLKMLQRLIPEEISLEWTPADPLPVIYMDPTQIDQVLMNLVVNARDAIDGVGKIVIATDTALLDEDYCAPRAGLFPGEYLRLTVSDTGNGIEEQNLTKVFEPFFSTKAPGSGTGLGLATVYGIVKQNNGFIEVESKVGVGTSFRIYLPPHTIDGDRLQEPSEMREPLRGSETVLVVEDEVSILSLASTLLEGLGYSVLTANGPKEALAKAHEHEGPIDLLMTDVVMPDMNGRELKDELSKERPGLRCLFVSGYAEDVIANRGVLLKDEDMHFLQKPYTERTLSTKLREALR